MCEKLLVALPGLVIVVFIVYIFIDVKPVFCKDIKILINWIKGIFSRKSNFADIDEGDIIF